MPIIPLFTVYLEGFRESFVDPFTGLSYKLENSSQRTYNNVSSIIMSCKFKSLEEMFTEDGLERIRKAFDVPVQSGTKMQKCQSLVDFLRFLEFEETGIEENERMQPLGPMERAVKSFKRGRKFDRADKRIKLSRSMHDGLFPTYTEVSRMCDCLAIKVAVFSSSATITRAEYINLVAYIAFRMTKRCFIRPGALTLMTLREFEDGKFIGSDSFIVFNRSELFIC